MVSTNGLAGYKLPTNPSAKGGTVAQGFVTPTQDRIPQVQSIPPRRVLPIIFIPGIMGSNLRMSSVGQLRSGQKNNMAWRPDKLFFTYSLHDDTATERQLRFDPDATELDTYDPLNDSTGDSDESSDERNSNIDFLAQYGGWGKAGGPLLKDDIPWTKNSRTRAQKARERGWGEVYFSSYQIILRECELRLNAGLSERYMDRYLANSVVKISPSKWQIHPSTPLEPIDLKEMRAALKGCWFPVHAMGYNWLRENFESGVIIAGRIRALISSYEEQGYQCEKVVLVTHSMGGLVARAVIHPEMGGLNDKVLGIVHGVMPAVGAATAYKRIRCGFEGDNLAAEILGAKGSHVTCVLANSQGGLELLPSRAYGNGWLQIMQGGNTIKRLPEKGDPYEEIYKIKGKWFSLLREEWINPAGLSNSGFSKTCVLLEKAKKFHERIAETYHEQSYAHYGADNAGLTWHKVTWKVDADVVVEDFDNLMISKDDQKGNLLLKNPISRNRGKDPEIAFNAGLQGAADPGDQTVPVFFGRCAAPKWEIQRDI